MRLWESIRRALDSLPGHDAVTPELTERTGMQEGIAIGMN